MFALLIPAIMWVGHKVFGALEPTVADTVAAELSKLSMSSGIVGDILKVFQQSGVVTSTAQEEQFKLQLNSLLGQIDLDKQDAQSESLFKSGYRPFVAWGLGINLVLHESVRTLISILHVAHIEIIQIAPLDTVTLSFMAGLLGLYMTQRTVEKVTGTN